LEVSGQLYAVITLLVGKKFPVSTE